MEAYFEKIKKLVDENKVVLFMKGSSGFPMCGFSSLVCQALNKLEVPFTDINILEDGNMREAIKQFSNWPTIPQLYINGEFIGGSDIVKALYESGELATLLQK